MSNVNKASTFELDKISRFVSVKCNLPRRDKNYNYSFQMDSSYLDNFQNNNKLFVANNYLIKMLIFIIFEPSIKITIRMIISLYNIKNTLYYYLQLGKYILKA